MKYAVENDLVQMLPKLLRTQTRVFKEEGLLQVAVKKKKPKMVMTMLQECPELAASQDANYRTAMHHLQEIENDVVRLEMRRLLLPHVIRQTDSKTSQGSSGTTIPEQIRQLLDDPRGKFKAHPDLLALR
jgi:hypothetical protein